MVDYDLPEIKGNNCCLRWMCPTDHRPKNAQVVFGGKNVDCHLLSASEMNRAATERVAAITVHGELRHYAPYISEYINTAIQAAMKSFKCLVGELGGMVGQVTRLVEPVVACGGSCSTPAVEIDQVQQDAKSGCLVISNNTQYAKTLVCLSIPMRLSIVASCQIFLSL